MRQLPKGISNYEDIVAENRVYVDKTMYSAQISDLISSLIIYLCGFVLFFKYIMNKRLDRQEDRRRAKDAETAVAGRNQASQEGGAE